MKRLLLAAALVPFLAAAAAEAAVNESGRLSTRLSPLYHAALLAQAEQALALRLYSAFFPPEEK